MLRSARQPRRTCAPSSPAAVQPPFSDLPTSVGHRRAHVRCDQRHDGCGHRREPEQHGGEGDVHQRASVAAGGARTSRRSCRRTRPRSRSWRCSTATSLVDDTTARASFFPGLNFSADISALQTRRADQSAGRTGHRYGSERSRPIAKCVTETGLRWSTRSVRQTARAAAARVRRSSRRRCAARRSAARRRWCSNKRRTSAKNADEAVMLIIKSRKKRALELERAAPARVAQAAGHAPRLSRAGLHDGRRDRGRAEPARHAC